MAGFIPDGTAVLPSAEGIVLAVRSTGAVDALAHQEAVETMLGQLDMPLHYICGRLRTVPSVCVTTSPTTLSPRVLAFSNIPSR